MDLDAATTNFDTSAQSLIDALTSKSWPAGQLGEAHRDITKTVNQLIQAMTTAAQNQVPETVPGLQ